MKSGKGGYGAGVREWAIRSTALGILADPLA